MTAPATAGAASCDAATTVVAMIVAAIVAIVCTSVPSAVPRATIPASIPAAIPSVIIRAIRIVPVIPERVVPTVPAGVAIPSGVPAIETIRAIAIEAIVTVEPRVVPVEIVETAHTTAVCVVALVVIVGRFEDFGAVLGSRMELNDIITQGVGAYCLIIAVHRTSVILINVS